MLIRSNPWQVLNDINTILDSGMRAKMSDDSHVESSRWTPLVDIKEEPDKFQLMIDIPGVDPKEVEISMENNILTLKGSREEINEEDKKCYHRIERIKGSFHRRFTLPETADAEQVLAKAQLGILVVTIGKKKAGMARKIAIETV